MNNGFGNFLRHSDKRIFRNKEIGITETLLYNIEKYGTLKEAVGAGVHGALAVVGVFFQVNNNDWWKILEVQ